MPKSDCYEAALKLISKMDSKAYLVNGLIWSTKLDRYIKHAWVEHEGWVYDYSNDKEWKVKQETYYYAGKVLVAFKYSRAEALMMVEATGRYDFWSIDEREKFLGPSWSGSFNKEKE